MSAAQDSDGVAGLNRIRWRCRRGMLELDMVLERFLERHIAELTDAQLREFEQLIRQEDQALWRRIADAVGSASHVERLLRDCVVC